MLTSSPSPHTLQRGLWQLPASPSPHTLQGCKCEIHSRLETDKVYAKIRLVSMLNGDSNFAKDDGLLGSSVDVLKKPASFAETLTQSDANNGGGFSVPCYYVKTIFPCLEYSVNPLVQNILSKDVHEEIWKFQHVYQGTIFPRRCEIHGRLETDEVYAKIRLVSMRNGDSNFAEDDGLLGSNADVPKNLHLLQRHSHNRN